MDLYAKFIWSIDGELARLNTSTWAVNHASDESEGGNSVLSIEDGAIVLKSTVDIAAGTEIKMDYRKFRQPQFYLDFCKETDIQDVLYMVM